MTHRELDKLLALVIAQAKAIKIPVSDRICPQVRVNRRARTRFGCCIRRDGAYTIELSALLAREGSEDAVLQVLAHEVLVIDSGLRMHYTAQPGVIVKGDPDMLRQAVANLLSNAVRYTPEGGEIFVRVKGGDIMASISVEDTGIGLTREEAKMVFSRFWRADAGRTRESGGLGVGLAVVKEIVDRHGGWVQVEGEKGLGATFTIHIPLYDEKRAETLEKARVREAQRYARDAQRYARDAQRYAREARQSQKLNKRK